MFQPETEDMLPRAPPKPATNLNGVKPVVPEVSIIFGAQQQPTASNQLQPKEPQQTYASWKKQVLPKVTYPQSLDAEVNGEYATTTARSNLYPLRTSTATISPFRDSMTAGGYTNQPQPTDNGQHYQRRSLDSAAVYQTPPPMQQNVLLAAMTHQQQQLASPLNIVRQEILTICAGTQTDANVGSGSTESLRNLATKSDMEQLFAIMQEMRADQLHLRRICESLQQQVQLTATLSKKISFKDVATQCETAAQNNASPTVRRSTPIIHDYIKEEEFNNEVQKQQPLPSNNFFQLPPFQSPCRVSSPTAQSTGYRALTPRNNRPVLQPQQQHLMPKPSTEKSMVMNELALKYLPNEKISEMLHEIHLTPQQQATGVAANNTPLRNKENFDKGPSDISNASYKYLKKYRLLPEENNEGGGYQQQQQQQPPHLDNNKSPALMRHQQNAPQMLDLEHYRHQPKFM